MGAELSYSAAAGGLICGQCAAPQPRILPISGMTAGLLRALMSFSIDRLPRLSCPPDSEKEIAELIRRHIAYHLGFSPKSERFLQEISGTSEER